MDSRTKKHPSSTSNTSDVLGIQSVKKQNKVLIPLPMTVSEQAPENAQKQSHAMVSVACPAEGKKPGHFVTTFAKSPYSRGQKLNITAPAGTSFLATVPLPRPNVAVMDTTATDPDDACVLTPLDDCLRYLQRNPAMREVIGALIRQEEESKQETKAPKKEEENAVIKQSMDRFQVPPHKWHDELDCNDYQACCFPESSSTDDGAKQPKNEAVPDPPTKPSATAALRAITVYFNKTKIFDTSTNRMETCHAMKGFTMQYSDGIELQSNGAKGLLVTSGTKTKHYQLYPNEHVVSAEEVYYWPSGVLREILFLTTNRRVLGAGLEGETTHYTQTRAIKFTSGKVLQWVNWNNDSYETVSPDKIDKAKEIPILPLCELFCNVDESVLSNSIPTLAHLANEAVMFNFKNNVKKVERSSKVRQKALAETAEHSWRNIYERHREKLQATPEADFYRLLTPLVAKGKEKLEIVTQKLLESAKNEASSILHQIDAQRKDVRLECANEHVSIFKQHREFLDSCADVPSACDRGTLCFTPRCRKLFHYSKVARHQRCTETGCAVIFPNCGCSVGNCLECYRVLCILHLPSHQRDCLQKAAQKRKEMDQASSNRPTLLRLS